MAEDLDAELAAAMLGAGGAAGAAGYYGAKAMSQPSSVPMLDVVDESPFIERLPPEIPDVEGGFGSPEQRRAAGQASAGARGARKAVNPQDLYVPEFAPGGQRQPLDLEGRSRFRDHMKNPGSKGLLFDYVPEGTAGLIEEETRLQKSADAAKRAMNSNLLSTREKMKAANKFDELGRRIGSVRSVINEMGGMDSEIVRNQYRSGPASKISFGSGPIPFGREAAEFEDFINRPADPTKAVEEMLELDKIMNDQSRPFSERVDAQMKHNDVARRFGKQGVIDFEDEFAKSERARKSATRAFGFEDEYRKIASDEFGQKIEKGLDNARRYLDQSEVARELMTKRPKIPPNVRKGAKMAASTFGFVPDPTDLVLLALAGPYEMMFNTGIGKEPGTGTFDIPLKTTLQNTSQILDMPLDSRHINVDTRIRLADDDYPMASQLFSDGVLSREAFDIITRIRKARGGDTTVLPLLKPEPEAPEPGPAMGRPGRRF